MAKGKKQKGAERISADMRRLIIAAREVVEATYFKSDAAAYSKLQKALDPWRGITWTTSLLDIALAAQDRLEHAKSQKFASRVSKGANNATERAAHNELGRAWAATQLRYRRDCAALNPAGIKPIVTPTGILWAIDDGDNSDA